MTQFKEKILYFVKKHTYKRSIHQGKKNSSLPGAASILAKQTELLLDIVALVETLDTTCSINKFLLSCKERMAGRANFNIDVLYC